MSVGVRIFVATVFTAIGLSFIATTAVLVWEFAQTDWLGIASFYSHLFLFFPTFGIVTLLAFYTPACVFTDMYMKHVTFGIPRFLFGLLATVVLSLVASQQLLSAEERSIFELSPDKLRVDRGEPAGCEAGGTCQRLTILKGVENVRRVSQTRIGLADLARNCRPDTLKDPPPETQQSKRYCFASTNLPADMSDIKAVVRTTDSECCRSQRAFTDAVKRMHDEEGGRSLTAKAHAALLPFKIFFALVLFIISLMLAFRRTSVEENYSEYLSAIERGVLVGAVAMVVFPIMNHAFLQSAALLYFGGGPSGGYRALAPGFSFALGAWGLLLLFFFYGRQNERVQNLARMGGMIGSAVAVIKYDVIIDLFVRLFGTGAGIANIIAVCVVALGAVVVLMTWSNREHPTRRRRRGETV